MKVNPKNICTVDVIDRHEIWQIIYKEESKFLWFTIRKAGFYYIWSLDPHILEKPPKNHHFEGEQCYENCRVQVNLSSGQVLKRYFKDKKEAEKFKEEILQKTQSNSLFEF